MKEFRTHILGKISAVVLVFALMLPVSIKFFHIFENHLHEVCLSKDAKHIHQLEKDCEFYKFKLSNHFSIKQFEYQIPIITEETMEITSPYSFLSDYQKLHFTLRGPPQLM